MESSPPSDNQGLKESIGRIKACTAPADELKDLLSGLAKTDPAAFQKLMSDDYGISVMLNVDYPAHAQEAPRVMGHRSGGSFHPGADRAIGQLAKAKRDACLKR